MGLTRAVLVGTAYTFISFVISILFLHLASMYWFHQTAFEFLGDLDQSRSIIQQQTAITNPESFQAWVLQDKVFYFIITLVVLSIWLLNINHQYKNDGSETS